jgi:hypothetical protein
MVETQAPKFNIVEEADVAWKSYCEKMNLRRLERPWWKRGSKWDVDGDRSLRIPFQAGWALGYEEGMRRCLRILKGEEKP